jgi:hypothetical protein
MPMRTDKFLDMLEQRGILSPVDVESLREQVAEADRPMHPVFVARRLVTAGYLNAYYAKTLLTELAGTSAAEGETGQTASDAGREGGFADDLPPQTATGDTLDAFDDPGLVPIETKDLLSGADEAAPMLPSAQQRGFAGWAKGHKQLNLEGPGYERFLLPACFVLMGLVVLLLAFLVIRMVSG